MEIGSSICCFIWRIALRTDKGRLSVSTHAGIPFIQQQLMVGYLVTIDAPIKEKSAYQHTGVEFVHVLEGSMTYKYGQATQILSPGDSMLFDCNGPHGPQEAIKLPVKYLSVVVNMRS